MKKNNRDQYLKAWLTSLKGKNQIDPKALADFLGKTLKGALSPKTMKRYTATVIANLYENGFLTGKTGKTFSGTPLAITREITLPVLDKCLTQNYRKIKFIELDQAAELNEPVTEAPATKKPRKAAGKKQAGKPEVVAETPPKKPARKPVKAKAEKSVRRKPGPPQKKFAEKPKQGKVTGDRKALGRKPGLKKQKPIARKTDLLKRGEEAFFFALRQQNQIEEMERVIANYERMFQAVRQLFSREMEEIEELVAGLLE